MQPACISLENWLRHTGLSAGQSVSLHCLGCVFLALLQAPLVQIVQTSTVSIWFNGHSPTMLREQGTRRYVWPSRASVPKSCLGLQLIILLWDWGFLESHHLIYNINYDLWKFQGCSCLCSWATAFIWVVGYRGAGLRDTSRVFLVPFIRVLESHIVYFDYI